MSNFPEKPVLKFELEDLTSYLLKLQGMGLNIYQIQNLTNKFEIMLNEVYHLECSFNNSKCQVQFYKYNNIVNFYDVKNKTQLEIIISQLIKRVLGEFPVSSRSSRIFANKSATNYKSIANLIGSSEVVAFFDPYLDNSSLTELINICSFGYGKINQSIRLLTSKNKARGRSPTFTKAGVTAFFAEANVRGTAKVMKSDDEHRRFMLLSGGKSLLLGHSINSIHKNEAIRIESDTDDLKFFNELWGNAEEL